MATSTVRFWKSDLHSFAYLRLTMTPVGGKHAAGHEIGSGGPGYQFANYQQVPAGRCTLEVFDTPASTSGKPPAQPLASAPADFSADAFFTVLVTEGSNADGKPKVEVIEDTLSGEKPAAEPAQIIVRNFVSGLKDAHVSVGDVLNAQFASGAGLLVMRGVQPAVYQVRTSGTAPGGKAFEWNTEVDLKQNHRQTVLIYPDPYGRIRPRLSVDGEMLSEGGTGDRQR